MGRRGTIWRGLTHPILISALALVIAAGGLDALASTPAARPQTISACVGNSGGAMRLAVADQPCANGAEQTVEWNDAGVTGPVGSTGVPGVMGPTGPTGPTGPPGRYGVLQRFDVQAETGSVTEDAYSAEIRCPAHYMVPLATGFRLRYNGRAAKVSVAAFDPYSNEGQDNGNPFTGIPYLTLRVDRGLAPGTRSIAPHQNYFLQAYLSCLHVPFGLPDIGRAKYRHKQPGVPGFQLRGAGQG